MPGGQYIALSGMRTRLDQLDRLSTDLANTETAGYKAERTSDVQADRPSFDMVLQTAIDVTAGPRGLDTTTGSITPTGRELDVAIDGDGFIVLDTPNGTRYTRDGHLVKNPDGYLTIAGALVQGVDEQPIKVGAGKVQVASDGSVKVGNTTAGQLQIVQFPNPKQLVRENGAILRSDGMTPEVVDEPSVQSGVLEQSNVSVVQRLSELTNVSRTFEALQRAVSIQMNDLDGQAITILGRR